MLPAPGGAVFTVQGSEEHRRPGSGLSACPERARRSCPGARPRAVQTEAGFKSHGGVGETPGRARALGVAGRAAHSLLDCTKRRDRSRGWKYTPGPCKSTVRLQTTQQTPLTSVQGRKPCKGKREDSPAPRPLLPGSHARALFDLSPLLPPPAPTQPRGTVGGEPARRRHCGKVAECPAPPPVRTADEESQGVALPPRTHGTHGRMGRPDGGSGGAGLGPPRRGPSSLFLEGSARPVRAAGGHVRVRRTCVPEPGLPVSKA